MGNLDLESRLTEVLVSIRDNCQKETGSEIASIWSYEPETQILHLKKEFSSDGKEITVGLDERAIVSHHIARTKEFVVTDDVREEPRDEKGIIYRVKTEEETGVKIRQLMGVPIINIDEELLGVIQAMNNPNGYDETDIAILQIHARETAEHIEANKRGEIRGINSALEKIVMLVESINRASKFWNTLSSNIPENKEYSLSLMHLPCGKLGGDWHFAKSNGYLSLVIGDAENHDLVAYSIATICLSKIEEMLDDPRFSGANKMKELLTRLNNPLYARKEARSTMSYSIFQQDGIFFYLGAGHPEPLVFNKDGESKKIDFASGTLLGAFDEKSFCGVLENPTTGKLEKGDIFLAYTDGITDLTNTNRERYELARLISFISNSIKKDPKSENLLTELKKGLKDFAKVKYQRDDDITVVCVSYRG